MGTRLGPECGRAHLKICGRLLLVGLQWGAESLGAYLPFKQIDVDLAKRSVLVLDDDPDILQMVATVLDADGYRASDRW